MAFTAPRPPPWGARSREAPRDAVGPPDAPGRSYPPQPVRRMSKRGGLRPPGVGANRPRPVAPAPARRGLGPIVPGRSRRPPRPRNIRRAPGNPDTVPDLGGVRRASGSPAESFGAHGRGQFTTGEGGAGWPTPEGGGIREGRAEI